jgi:hypothetical protein
MNVIAVIALMGVILLFISIYKLKKVADQHTRIKKRLILQLIVGALFSLVGTTEGAILFFPYSCSNYLGYVPSYECDNRMELLKEIGIIDKDASME